MPARCVSGTEASQKRNAATQHPHPTHPARQTRHESDGRVTPRPNAASQDHKFPQALRNSPRSALAPASTAHLLRGHHALLHVDNGFVEITINFARGGSAGFTSLHLNQNARRIPEETMMVSSTRLDVVVPQAPCVRDVLPIVSGRCRATIRARRATTSSQRSRCPSTRSSLARALQRRDHPLHPMAFYRAAATTHLALHSLPSFQRRGSPDSWCVDDVPCRPRRPKVSARADEQR